MCVSSRRSRHTDCCRSHSSVIRDLVCPVYVRGEGGEKSAECGKWRWGVFVRRVIVRAAGASLDAWRDL